MSTTLLYHAFGIRGYRHVRLRNDGGVIYWRIERSPEKPLCCAACGSTDEIRRGGKDRSFRALPVGRKKTILQLRVRRLACRTCGALAPEPVDFADDLVCHTRNFESVESINNKIKTLQRQVYGYRDKDFFKLRNLAIHETR